MLPSTELPNALPNAWIDRLFMRFSVLYGRHWAEMWAGIPIADVKAAWSSELAGVRAEQIAAALKGLGTFPPTLPEFLALCRQSTTPTTHRLLLPDRRPRDPIPQHIRDVMRQFRERAFRDAP
jgi:hypothetical protein